MAETEFSLKPSKIARGISYPQNPTSRKQELGEHGLGKQRLGERGPRRKEGLQMIIENTPDPTLQISASLDSVLLLSVSGCSALLFFFFEVELHVILIVTVLRLPV